MAFSYFLGARTTAVATAVATTCCATIVIPAALTPAIAASPTNSQEISQTTTFLARQLAAGTGELGGENLLPGPKGASATIPKDVGMSQDYLFALKVIGGQDDQLNRSYEATTANLGSHIYFGDYLDANRLAKTVALDATMGMPDQERTQLLKSTVQSDGQVKDLQGDQPSSPVTNFGQSWAVIALQQTGNPDLAKSAAEFLAHQQCADGGVPLDQQSPPKCTSVDPDSTALAAQAFAYVLGQDDPATKNAIEYLKKNQAASGGINSRFAGVNSNTTALAAGAFVAVGDKDSFAKAHRYLDSTRFTDASPASLRGGFAHTVEKVATTSAVDDSVRRTSAQAALAFAGYNYVGSDPITDFGETPAPQDPTTAPTQPSPNNPAPKGSDSSGSSSMGIAVGMIAAIVAIIAAIAGAMNFQLPRGL